MKGARNRIRKQRRNGERIDKPSPLAILFNTVGEIADRLSNCFFI